MNKFRKINNEIQVLRRLPQYNLSISYSYTLVLCCRKVSLLNKGTRNKEMHKTQKESEFDFEEEEKTSRKQYTSEHTFKQAK